MSQGWGQPPPQQGGQGWAGNGNAGPGWGAPGPQPGGGYPAQPMPAYQPQQGQDMNYRGDQGGVGGAGPSTDGMLPLPLSPKSLARVGFGAYGEKFLGAGERFVTNNYAKYFSSTAMRYYFDVTEGYVLNKLRLVVCPFLHKGSWARIPEQVAGGLTFKPPRNDINAPDLYIPLMGYWSYVLQSSFWQVRKGTFTPDSVALHAWWAAVAWVVEIFFVWTSLRSISTTQMTVSAPILDIGAYTGYMFVMLSVALACKHLPSWVYYLAILWGALSSAVFMVKTMKRIIFSEARHHGFDSHRHNYLLLILAVAQFPLHLWLGSVN